MTLNIALFLSADGIALAHRQPAGHWAMIGETSLAVPDLGAALADLRAEAVAREGEDFKTLLVLPDDQMLYTSLTAPTSDPELTAFRIEEGLDGMTPYAVTELEYAWRKLEEDRVKIAVVARETLEEARGFAEQYGFIGAGFAAMPPMERFPGVPMFDVEGGEEQFGFSADGIAFGPDTFGQPEPEAEADPVIEDATDDVVEDDVAEPAPKAEVEPETSAEPELTTALVAETDVSELPVPEDAPAPDAMTEDPGQAPAPVDQVTEDAPAAPEEHAYTEPEPIAEADTVAPAPVASAEVAPTEDENAALAEALNMASEQDDFADGLPAFDDVNAPIQPISDADAEPADVLEDAESGDDPLPPAPSPASLAARQRARVIRGESPGPVPAPAEGEAQFTARRGRAAAPDTATGSLVGQRSSRIGLSHPDDPIPPAPEAAPELTPDAPTASTNAGMPRLAEQLQRVRSASKSKPKAAAPASLAAQPPRPRVEIEPRPDSLAGANGDAARVSPFDGPPPGQSDDLPSGARKGLLGGALRGRGGAKAAVASAGTAAGAAAEPARAGGLFRRNRAAEAETTAPSIPSGDGGGAAVAENESFTSGLLARKTVPSSGPSFKTGLILTVILLLLLALVAVWSAVFLPNSPVARLFGFGGDGQVASAPSGSNAPAAFTDAPVIGLTATPSLEDEAAADGIDLAPVSPEGEESDAPIEVAAVVEAPVEAELPDIDAEFDLPPLPPIDQGQNPSVEEAEALYAEDGIWARSPERPDLRPFDLMDRIYTASIDPAVSAFDAVALPDPGVNPGELLRRFPPPPPFGAEFDLTAEGLVEATPEGVVTPEGAFIVAGNPPVAARQRPREIEDDTPVAETAVDEAILAAFRPTERPEDLVETRERAVLGGFTEDELSERRPPERPQSPQEAAAEASLVPEDVGVSEEDVAAAVDAAIGGTELAVARSLMPTTRPANIAQIVASADRQPVEPATEVAAVAPEAAAAGPSIPSNADVSRAATERNAIRLRNVNLIGVTGTNSDRRALVRLSSGRFVRVGVGDRLDGGRVAAIGETTLQYVRNGRTVTLEIPG
ncbi:hypothetical protein HKCCE4037_11145 [Rhodobacterales bacterium HKCCE4037]|nr:hypothetical protein [Rhodobacterales bacterium HKCCE4037]